MILDLDNVTFTPAMLQAAWDAQVTHFADLAKTVHTHSVPLLAFQRLAERVRATSWSKRLHPGLQHDALQIHPCHDGRIDRSCHLSVGWVGGSNTPYLLTLYVAAPDPLQPMLTAAATRVSEAELEAQFWALLTDRIALLRPRPLVFAPPRVIQARPKYLVGKHMRMSRNQDLTPVLWRSFMPLRNAIPDSIGTDLFSVNLYPAGYFEAFDPHVEFEKWAAVEVEEAAPPPDGLAATTLPGGLYAVFAYTGASSDHRIYDFIYREWLPKSSYLLDARPHFEVLGEKYRHNDPLSEEEIWIPVRPR
jgi:AraC family transcriptional regulator